MIKIKPEPDIELTQAEYDRLHREWQATQMHTVAPSSFESYVRERMRDREIAIGQAVLRNDGKWPAQLESGTMFFDGETITRKDFMRAKRS